MINWRQICHCMDVICSKFWYKIVESSPAGHLIFYWLMWGVYSWGTPELVNNRRSYQINLSWMYFDIGYCWWIVAVTSNVRFNVRLYGNEWPSFCPNTWAWFYDRGRYCLYGGPLTFWSDLYYSTICTVKGISIYWFWVVITIIPYKCYWHRGLDHSWDKWFIVDKLSLIISKLGFH